LRDRSDLYKEYGLLLSEIERKTGIPKKELHIELKKSQGIDTLKEVENDQLQAYIWLIRECFLTELGLPLREYGEMYDIENISMEELLKLKSESYIKWTLQND
jgi:hypothetical protein